MVFDGDRRSEKIFRPITIDRPITIICLNGYGGRMMIRPYGGGKFRFQFHNTVNMIGHHDKFTQNHIRKMICNFQPTFIGNTARIIQYHFAIFIFPNK